MGGKKKSSLLGFWLVLVVFIVFFGISSVIYRQRWSITNISRATLRPELDEETTTLAPSTNLAKPTVPEARPSVQETNTPRPSGPSMEGEQRPSYLAPDDYLGFLRRYFGIVEKESFEEDSKVYSGRSGYVRKWRAHLDSPFRFDPLAAEKWNGDQLVNPVRQEEPYFEKAEGPRYFEGYKYAQPHRCPGNPYSCSGKGVCDTTRGVCICRPPWTGWRCEVNMAVSTTTRWTKPVLAVGDAVVDFTSKHCSDQNITDPKVEKWNKRAVDRCMKIADQNGMWLGLSQKLTKIMALGIANALGVRDGQTVLDIGMGCGDTIRHISSVYRIRPAGIDYSEAAVHFVRRNISGGVFCVADVRNLSFIPSNSVDHAYESGVFSVTRDGHCETYRNVMRILRPGGTLLIHQMHHEHHEVKCWQNILMQSVERCLGPLGVRMEYILTRSLTEGAYDTYCAGETYTGLYRKPLSEPVWDWKKKKNSSKQLD